MRYSKWIKLGNESLNLSDTENVIIQPASCGSWSAEMELQIAFERQLKLIF